MKRWAIIGLLVFAAVGAGVFAYGRFGPSTDSTRFDPARHHDLKGLSVATFAGGCFWCVEAAYEEAPGVVLAVSGYSGGVVPFPSYRRVALGLTRHTEAVQVYYDHRKITYEGLLQILWRTADPTDVHGQFSDRGRQYRPAVFYHDEAQRQAALRSREALSKSGRFDEAVKIEIVPYKAFYPAENYHQDYYRKNPLHYRLYTIGSGRDAYQRETWGADLLIDFAKYRPAPESKVGSQPSAAQAKPGPAQAM